MAEDKTDEEEKRKLITKGREKKAQITRKRRGRREGKGGRQEDKGKKIGQRRKTVAHEIRREMRYE